MNRTALRAAILTTSLAFVIALLAGSRSGADSRADARADNSQNTGSNNAPARVATSATNAPFAVHEWGTFTSMQGSTGVELDGMQHEGESLPAFVYSFTETVPSPFRAHGDRSRNPQVRRTRSKMETPVIYFHSARPLDVAVTVQFVHGLMSHYYPAPTAMTPRAPTERATRTAPLNLNDIGASMLHWQAHIAPERTDDDLPDASGNHYAMARAVDAAKVHVTSAAGVTENERFLFYRGLGRDNPDIHITAEPRGRARVHNAEPQAVNAAFAIEMQAERGRFVALGEIAAGRQVSFDLDALPFTTRKQAVENLAEHMFQALRARGLHADEARAMVATWTDQWFGSVGTRVVYVVPSAYVDRTLPMSIEPIPDELLRVFVGRIEYLTPEEEQRIADDLRASGSLERTAREAAMARLAGHGRFMEPKLRRVVAVTRDQVVYDRARALLGAMDTVP